MKTPFRRYYIVTGQWVEILFDFDEKKCFVKSLEDDLTDLFLVEKNKLINIFQYVVLLTMGKIYSDVDHAILSYFNKNVKFSLNKISDDLKISSTYLLKQIDSLSKRNYINYEYDEENKEIRGWLLRRAERKFVKNIKPKINKVWLIFLFLIILSSLGVNQQSVGCQENKIKIETLTYKDMVEKRMNHIEKQEFDYGLFVEYLKYVGIENKNVVKSQALLETGFFTSQIFFENNNLFGMKKPYVRKTLVSGVNRGHATYGHWTDSVKDYVLWYDFMTRNKTYNNYYDFLVTIGYAEDGGYIQKLKHIEQRIINNNIYLAYGNNN